MVNYTATLATFRAPKNRLLKVPKADLDEQRERHRDGGTSTTTWRTG